MAAITAADVNKLRTMTGAGMMDCKKALTEADGDFEAARDILRKAGQKIADKRAENETSEGFVAVSVSEDGTNGKLVALACETESVAKVANFRELVQRILDAAVRTNAVTKEDLLATKEEDGLTIQEHITDLMGKIGEKLDLTYATLTAEKVASYIHSDSKKGVLVGLKNVGSADAAAVGRDVAMQIVAMKPVAVDKDGVDSATVEREIEIGKEQARAEGKPEAMLEKIAQGKLNKFYKENTLLNQEFVKDNSLTIAALLDSKSKGMTVSDFKRVAIGA
ncbi:translation elongation factor Ts [Hymenobacter sp. BT770]|uniref:translation elongation factor Ts n=1 Tax=Hymenobacter sp. BT770 TaxID=2886942 RepID=UPI001D10C880|nr:translation elongation factor Ts [Hymenobacter sp. BT770]MCC3151848.1 translation elongation factor Ts [Hymenobacter sp. BT770]MDO3413530.1 translation elongation factor Ts [Hymenobacter sp. BT770]